ncbi:MAG: ABC transporter ATP-binding protein [Thermoplasmata archaeon]
MVILEIDDLTTGYKEKPILHGLNLSMEKVDFIGVIGPNGSGKSTLIRAITQIIEPWKGQIKLKNKSITELSRKEIGKTAAVVPQNTFISFPYSAWEIVLMGRTPYLGRFENPTNKDHKIAENAMKATSTYKFKDRKVKELSGGELQRVIVARALTQKPDLLLLDEGTSHLDIGHKIEIMDLVKNKNKKDNLSVLSVHHNLNLAARYCDKIVLLDEGKVHAFGLPENVLTKPHLRAVYGVEAEVHENPKDGSLYVTPVEKRSQEEQNGKRIHVICGGGSIGKLLKLLIEEGYEVSAGVLNVMDSDLERAEFLDISVITEAPFSSISDKKHRENLTYISDSDIVIGTSFPIGEGNIKNLKAIKKAAEEGKKIFLIEKQDINTRDYTDGKGKSLYKEIKKNNNVTMLDEEKDILSLL